jgi:hypothetical protein
VPPGTLEQLNGVLDPMRSLAPEMALASAVVLHGTLVWAAGLAAAAVGANPTSSAMIPPPINSRKAANFPAA